MARIRKTPIGIVSNFRKRSVIKNSLLNILENSDVFIPIRDNTPIEIKPIIGSPRIKEITVISFFHQVRSLSPSVTSLISQHQI
mgnify:CR=1 FL=1